MGTSGLKATEIDGLEDMSKLQARFLFDFTPDRCCFIGMASH